MARYFALFVLFALIMALPFFLFGDQLTALFDGEGAIRVLREYGSLGWLVAIALLVADLILPIPAAAVLGALGIVYGPVAGGLIGAGGSFLSGIIAYTLCRLFGQGVALRIAGARSMQRGEKLFAANGGWLVVASRWLPLLPEVVACLAGLSRMPVIKFCAALACGVLPVSFVYATVGHTGADNPTRTLILCALLPVLLWILVRPVLLRFEKRAQTSAHH